MAVRQKLLDSTLCLPSQFKPLYSFSRKSHLQASTAEMSLNEGQYKASFNAKTINSHLHIGASPEEATDKYSYFPGQEPTLPGHLQPLLQFMEEAHVDGAFIVQPINHKFDHSLVTRFVGSCIANPAEGGSNIKQLEQHIQEDGYRAVRFKPYLWPSGQQALRYLVKNDEKNRAFSNLLKRSDFCRVSRMASPYQDLAPLLSPLVSSFGANRIMWGSGRKGAKESVAAIANEIPLSSSELGMDHG